MVTLTEEQAVVIDRFLSEHWPDFESHCQEEGVDAEKVMESLIDWSGE